MGLETSRVKFHMVIQFQSYQVIDHTDFQSSKVIAHRIKNNVNKKYDKIKSFDDCLIEVTV
jgi:hypothetical protein